MSTPLPEPRPPSAGPAGATAVATRERVDPRELMTLAGLCYARPHEFAGALADRSLATGGRWRAAWGPVGYNGNLLYAAYCEPAHAYVIAIRGTMPRPGWDQLVNLFQDTDVRQQHPWPYPESAGARVASGATQALGHLLRARDGERGIGEFVEQVVAPSGAALVVTGHSLGGWLATVLAAYLHHRLANGPHAVNLSPVTFAAPTFGDQAFADHVRRLFGRVPRYANPLDLVPMGWANIADVASQYEGGPRCPAPLGLFARRAAAGLERAGLRYVQPGDLEPLPGTLSRRHFLVQWLEQHDPSTYLRLLGAPPLPFPLVRGSDLVRLWIPFRIFRPKIRFPFPVVGD